jgi:hypothetical protein
MSEIAVKGMIIVLITISKYKSPKFRSLNVAECIQSRETQLRANPFSIFFAFQVDDYLLFKYGLKEAQSG